MIGSVVERLPDKKEVDGSIPSSPTPQICNSMYCLESFRRLIANLRRPTENASLLDIGEQEPQRLDKEAQLRNDALFQLWAEYRPPDTGKVISYIDVATNLQEAGFSIDILSQQRIRALTEKEIACFRHQHAIGQDVEIRGEMYPYDGNGHSWLHVIDWALCNNNADIIYRTSRQPKSWIYFAQPDRSEHQYSFIEPYQHSKYRSTIRGSRVSINGDQMQFVEFFPEDRDALAAVYLIPDTGWEKGQTFWNRSVSATIARPDSYEAYNRYTFYNTFQLCSGALKITNCSKTFTSTNDYLHVIQLQEPPY